MLGLQGSGTHMHTHVHTHMYTHTCTHTCTHTHSCTHTHMCFTGIFLVSRKKDHSTYFDDFYKNPQPRAQPEDGERAAVWLLTEVRAAPGTGPAPGLPRGSSRQEAGAEGGAGLPALSEGLGQPPSGPQTWTEGPVCSGQPSPEPPSLVPEGHLHKEGGRRVLVPVLGEEVDVSVSWRVDGWGGVHQESSVHSRRMLRGTASPHPRNASHPTPPPESFPFLTDTHPA